MICRICTNGKGLKFLPAGRAQYINCPMCRCLFVQPYPIREINSCFEGAEVVDRLEKQDDQRRGYFIKRLKRLERRLGAGHQWGRLLEIGCGPGILLQEAWRRGWRADAIELSGDLAARARENNPTARIIQGDIQTHEPTGTAYDGIMALDVLEHVLTPLTAVENCRELLRPGGLLMLQTPNTRSLRCRIQGAKWDMLDPDQHLNLFSSEALRVLLTTVGFDILEMTTASGSGVEKGAAGIGAQIKESLLGVMNLGSALLVVARRRL